MKNKHLHYWLYPHNIIEGRNSSELAIVRQCNICKAKQVTFISKKLFRKATGAYALNIHYE